jgi:hypothetical protein
LGCPANGISLRGVNIRTSAVCAASFRRPDEGRLRKVEFGGDGLHLRRRQAFRIEDDGKRIARESIGREHIDSLELQPHRTFLKR